MDHIQGTPAPHSRAEQARRIVIWAFIIAVPWIPGGVALAMVLTGKAGS